jgi:3-oxoacyl-[acyl-carrier-protein] synthase II
MKAYINGAGNISPQRTWAGGLDFLNDVADHNNHANCIEPEYSSWINVQQLRRMSRIMKFGVTAALMALRDAKLDKADAIIGATGYGCLEDTITFLSKISTLQESALNPTPFMQSTHNTIASVVALLTQCQGYNQTYVQDAFSFEHALLDALMQIQDDPDQNILVGGFDELTETSHTIKKRFGIYRDDQITMLKAIENPGTGVIEGEGAAWFVLSGKKNELTKACINGVQTLYNPSSDELKNGIEILLNTHHVRKSDIDLVLLGKTGDARADQFTDEIYGSIFPSTSALTFKQFCGEHTVASSFAIWLAMNILNTQAIPSGLYVTSTPKALRNVLIYNPYFYRHHSFLLLTACHDIKG